MQIYTIPAEISDQCRKWQAEGKTIALVPTMGYYHKGHESLMRQARNCADKVVVSLFVNPTQFGPAEDLDSYPRDFERDCMIAEKNGVDAIFCPDSAAMYEENHAAWVEVPTLASGLCGASRPGHFRGVCTVVLKLFMITRADTAFFGQKDWQQQAIIKRMVRDLNIPLQVISLPIVRENDGLALSSRNVYLSENERAQAPYIYKGLELGRTLAAAGEKNAEKLRTAILTYWAENLPLGKPDYLSVIHPDSLEILKEVNGPALIACAVHLGKARLIDNILLK